MDNQELRRIKERLGWSDFRINFKTGVHYGVVEDFFSGKTDELAPKDRQRIEAVLAEAQKR